MQLLFNPRSLPRAITREQWREADRWRRVVQRKIAEHLDVQMRIVRAFEATMPNGIHREIIERLSAGAYAPSALSHSLTISDTFGASTDGPTGGLESSRSAPRSAGRSSAD